MSLNRAVATVVSGTPVQSQTEQIRRLAMTYYGSGDPGGNLGDLMTVSLQTLVGTRWETISTSTTATTPQIYDGTANTQPGYVHGLKFVVGPEAFARLSRQTNPFTAPDQTVANYADRYFEYTALVGGVNSRRVTKSVTDGGTLPHYFAYTSSGFTTDYNQCRR